MMQMSFLNGIREIEQTGLARYMLDNLDYLVDPAKLSVYVGTQFEWVLKLSSRGRGVVGERYIGILAKSLGFWVESPRKNTGDVNINGVDVEVKFARICESGAVVVNQIRPQDYQYVAIVLMSPSNIEIFTVEKTRILGLSTGQHTGSEAKETFKYSRKNYEAVVQDIGDTSGLRYFYDTFRLHYAY